MTFIRQRVLGGEVLAGTFLNLGSSLTAEMAGRAGFDWLLIDLEHGAGDHESLVHQLQAIGNTPAAPIVRIAWNEPPRFKRVLDLGAAGVIVCEGAGSTPHLTVHFQLLQFSMHLFLLLSAALQSRMMSSVGS